jgi:hypothetical protein
MNTTQNKAALWKSCVEQGIFDKVPSGLQPQVQELFEKTIQQFNQESLDLGNANQLVLKEFKIQLGKMTGTTIPQKSFEELNEDYRGQYKAKIPDKIEFSKEMDTPLENMDLILKSKAEQRQNEIHEFFREKKDSEFPTRNEPITLPLSLPVSLPIPPISNTSSNTSLNSVDTQLQLHRRILESILESQLKIIDLLQRK